MAVRLLTGGWPCQPHSLAGKRLADADERDGWRSVVAALRHGRPDIAFLENVAGVLSSDDRRYWGGCLADLAGLGYDAEWLVLGANNAGADHRRRRLWILAWRRDVADSLRDGRSARSESDGGPIGSGQQTSQRDNAHRCDPHVADADVERLRAEPRCEQARELDAGWSEHGLADADAGSGQEPGGVRQRVADAVLGGGAEGRRRAEPTVGRVLDGLATGLDWPARRGDRPSAPGEAQRPWEAARTTASFLGRADAIRAIGNGWDIPCAVMAFNELMRRAGFR